MSAAKRVSDRPLFILIAVRSDTDHRDWTELDKLRRGPLMDKNNYKIESSLEFSKDSFTFSSLEVNVCAQFSII